MTKEGEGGCACGSSNKRGKSKEGDYAKVKNTRGP